MAVAKAIDEIVRIEAAGNVFLKNHFETSFTDRLESLNGVRFRTDTKRLLAEHAEKFLTVSRLEKPFVRFAVAKPPKPISTFEETSLGMVNGKTAEELGESSFVLQALSCFAARQARKKSFATRLRDSARSAHPMVGAGHNDRRLELRLIEKPFE